MSVMIQVRNVPDAIHRRLKARAAEEGVSLSDFVMAELRRVAERPSRREILQEVCVMEHEEELENALRTSDPIDALQAPH